MLQYYFPVIFVIAFNTIYHICAKNIPGNANPLALLVATYMIAAATSFVLFVATTGNNQSFVEQIKAITWAPVFLGFAIVGLEFGFILIYRVGWNLSLASLVCNAGVAMVLIVIGLLIYKEQINSYQVAGIILCLAGLALINKP